MMHYTPIETVDRQNPGGEPLTTCPDTEMCRGKRIPKKSGTAIRAFSTLSAGQALPRANTSGCYVGVQGTLTLWEKNTCRNSWYVKINLHIKTFSRACDKCALMPMQGTHILSTLMPWLSARWIMTRVGENSDLFCNLST